MSGAARGPMTSGLTSFPAIARPALLLLALALASACTQGGAPPAAPAPHPLPPDPAPTAPAPTVTPGGSGELAPAASRSLRRMNIDQLDASMRRATGGVGWVDGNGNDLFSQLAGTLGKPDYLQRTREDLDPSPIFQKFLDDAARSVCDRLVREEGARPPAARVLFTRVPPDHLEGEPDPPAAVDANLIALLARFHGRKLDASAPELDGWRWLYRSAYQVSRSPQSSWRTVCVALFTHPDFYLY